MKFDFRSPQRSGEDVATLKGVSKSFGARTIYDGFDFHVRRGERWCVMGKNGAGKSTLLKMVAGALQPDAGSVKLGASLKMGYFAQQALDLLDPNLTVWEQIQKDFPLESIGTLRSLLGAFQFSGDDVDKTHPLPLRRREVATGHGAHAPRSAELPRPRRADEPSRSGDEGNARRSAAGIRRNDALRLARPHVPARPRQSRARARAGETTPRR